MVILYVETNFLLSFATGRDPEAETLLQETPEAVQLVIPGICYMESLSALEDEVKRQNRFKQKLDLQLNEARRDVTSPHAQSLVGNLEQCKIAGDRRLNDIKLRLRQSTSLLSAKAETIPLTPEIIQESLNLTFIEKDLTDNLILHCILNHARSQTESTKILLTANVKEFGKLPEVQDALTDVGIQKYFSRTQNFLGWLNAQPSG